MSGSRLHPQAFVHGYADELAGRGFLDNPYAQDSTEARVWVDGYVRSMRERGTGTHRRRHMGLRP